MREFKKFIRLANNRPIGVMVVRYSDVSPGILKFGCCIETRPQLWNKKLGTEIARGRCNKSDINYFQFNISPSNYVEIDTNVKQSKLNHSILEQMDYFVDNCRRIANKKYALSDLVD